MFSNFFGYNLCSFLSFDILLRLYAVYTECTLKTPIELYDCVFINIKAITNLKINKNRCFIIRD